MSSKNEKLRNSLLKAKRAVEQANETLNNVMLELDDDSLNAITGAGDPWEKHPRNSNDPMKDEPNRVI